MEVIAGSHFRRSHNICAFMLSFSLALISLGGDEINALADTARQACERVDLRESPCLPKPKNQSDSDWCYAYSAALVVSFQFCQEVSAAALGLLKSETSAQPENFWLYGGFPDEAIELGNKNGFCLESELPSQLIIQGETMALRRAYLSLLQEIDGRDVDRDCAKIEQLHFRDLLPLVETSAIIQFLANGQKPDQLYKLAKSS